MKKNKLRNKMFINIIIIVFINVITLTIWFGFKVYPANAKYLSISDKVFNNKIKTNYDEYDQILKDLDSLKKKYNIKYEIINIDNANLVKDEIKGNDLFLFNKLVFVNDAVYNINIYMGRNFNAFSVAIELIVFQITIIFITMLMLLMFTKLKIINPIEVIISDIRNYKLGKRPVKKNLKGEFSIIQNEFVKLVDSLEEERCEQRRIIASISHDIKTPLTSVIGYSDIIDSSYLSISEIKKYNRKINEKALHIKEIVSSFDDYLVNQTNQVLKLDDIYIKDLVSDLISDYKIDLDNINIELVISNKCFDEDIIRVDILKLKRVFANVISNSIRYMDKVGIIRIEISKEKGFYKFIIKDNGSGVDEGIIDKIFDPLFTTDKSRKISGLGLSICLEFVKMHGGDIVAYNNEGFVIEFTIPFNNS